MKKLAKMEHVGQERSASTIKEPTFEAKNDESNMISE